MIGFYIDLSVLDNTNDKIRNKIIKEMPPTGIYYDRDNFYSSNILIILWGKGYPCKLCGCNSEKDVLFQRAKISCEIFGKTRLVNFLKYIRDPYNEFPKRSVL